MKKIIESILSITILLALVVGGAQTESGGPVLQFTLPCIAIIFLCGLGLKALDTNNTQLKNPDENTTA